MLKCFNQASNLLSLGSTDETFNNQLEIFRDKPFYIWDPIEHRNEDIIANRTCCFNHIIGLPRKDGIEKPLFD